MIKVFGKNIDNDQIAKRIMHDAEQRHKDANISMPQLQAGRISSPADYANNEAFLDALLIILHDTAFVNFGDFEIIERRKHLGKPLVAFKKIIWSLLRFYTFRLWSQQNDVNGFLLSSLQVIHENANEKIARLEARIAELEKQK
jgi:phosphopantetheinyl transferase (holo-ACP synthase)